MCPSHLGAAGIRALVVNTETQHCLLGHKACLLPCQLVTLPGGPTPSGQLSLEASLMAAGTSSGILSGSLLIFCGHID